MTRVPCDALQFLMTREITHMKAFMTALDSLGMGPLQIGKLPPSEDVVGLYFNASTGQGEKGAGHERSLEPGTGAEDGQQPGLR